MDNKGPSVHAETIVGNQLTKTNEVRTGGDHSVMAYNRFETPRGKPTILRSNVENVVEGNVFTAPDPSSFSRAVRTRGDNGRLLCRSNHMEGFNNVVRHETSDPIVVSDNVFANTHTPFDGRAGQDKSHRISGNVNAPVHEADVTFTSGETPAARIEGVCGVEGTTPQIRSIEPDSDGGDDSFAYRSYVEWNGAESQWDAVVEWETDPGTDLDANISVDMP
jgi:hypothetical protein